MRGQGPDQSFEMIFLCTQLHAVVGPLIIFLDLPITGQYLHKYTQYYIHWVGDQHLTRIRLRGIILDSIQGHRQYCSRGVLFAEILLTTPTFY